MRACQERDGGEIAHFPIEQPFLITNAGNQAARMAVRQVGRHIVLNERPRRMGPGVRRDDDCR
jgi:hypothetical protein